MSTPTPTASLPQSRLADELSRATHRASALGDLASAGHTLSMLEWDDLAHAEDLMAGLLPLIGGA